MFIRDATLQLVALQLRNDHMVRLTNDEASQN